jgi:hypothetical protein
MSGARAESRSRNLEVQRIRAPAVYTEELAPPTYGVENANTSWELLIPQTPSLPVLMEMSEPGTSTKFNVLGSRRRIVLP